MSRDVAFQKGLPANLEAERLTLGAILVESDSFGLVGSDLSASDFSLESHRRIFERMAAIAERGEKIDRVALANELMRNSELESVGGLSYLMQLDDGTPRSLNVAGYVGIIKEKAALRNGIYACQALMDAMFMQSRPVGELLGQAAALQEILSSRDALTVTAAQVYQDFGFDNLFGPASNDGGVMLPWPGLAEIVPFLRPGGLTIVAAETGRGKSSFARQIALGAALRQFVGVHIWSGEMTAAELITSMTCTHAGVDGWRVFKDALSDIDRHRLAEAASAISDAPIYITDTGNSLLKLRAEVEKSKRRLKARQQQLGLVIVDYLQLMSPGRRTKDDTERIGAVARGLKMLASDVKVPVVALSQFSRREPGKSLTASDLIAALKGSSEIEQAANIAILLIASKTDMEMNPPPKVVSYQVHVAKNRSGPIGMKIMSFERSKTRFFEDSPRLQEVV
jgi:replicative DNA helicase